jgi:hypothetical protein
MISGELVVAYRDGSAETCGEGDVFHWPAGHTVRVVKDAEVIVFSPAVEHGEVIDHMLAKIAGA